MNKRSWLLFIWLLCTGCGMFSYHAVSLSYDVVNDANNVLSVEGNAELPDGALVYASLAEHDRTILRARSQVKNGLFFFTMDVSAVPGNTSLVLEVYSDPKAASPEIQAYLGQDGEYMVGSQVEETADGNRLVQRTRLVLPMNKRDAAIRRIRAGDYALGVAGLEGIIEVDPDDHEAVAWLALALLQHSQSERTLGSRAHDLLRSAHVDELPEPLRSECSVWFDRWTEQERVAAALCEREEAIQRTRQQREAVKTQVEPGVSLAGVAIGADARQVYQLCIPDKYPIWTGDIVKYHMKDRDVDVLFDGHTAKVLEVATSSSRIALRDGVRVGDQLYQVEAAYPNGRLVMQPRIEKGNGLAVAYGEYSDPSGLVFSIKRTFGPDGPLFDRLESFSVIPPFSWTDELPTSLPKAEPFVDDSAPAAVQRGESLAPAEDFSSSRADEDSALQGSDVSDDTGDSE